MIITLLGVYMAIVGIMTLTLIRSQVCQKYKLLVWVFCPL